jgi:hypothetical protein
MWLIESFYFTRTEFRGVWEQTGSQTMTMGKGKKKAKFEK